MTGAAAGIGLASARAFRDAGYRVVLLDRDTGGVAAAAAELGRNALAFACDISRSEEV